MLVLQGAFFFIFSFVVFDASSAEQAAGRVVILRGTFIALLCTDCPDIARLQVLVLCAATMSRRSMAARWARSVYVLLEFTIGAPRVE